MINEQAKQMKRREILNRVKANQAKRLGGPARPQEIEDKKPEDEEWAAAFLTWAETLSCAAEVSSCTVANKVEIFYSPGHIIDSSKSGFIH